MFNRNVSKLIVTFAFFYSAVICHFKAIEFYEKKEFLLSYFLWFCALTSFLGAYLSYFLDAATGGIIVCLQGIIFFIVFFVAPKYGYLSRRASKAY